MWYKIYVWDTTILFIIYGLSQHKIFILTSIKLLATPNWFKKYLLYTKLSTKHVGFTEMKKKPPLCSQTLKSNGGE